MEQIHILQLGKEDWNNIYTLPPNVSLKFMEKFEKVPDKQYDLFFLDRTPLEDEVPLLYQAVKAYTLFITKYVDISGKVAWLCCSKRAQHIAVKNIQTFLLQEAKYYYPKPQGEKLDLKYWTIAQGFSGKVMWDENSVTLEGDYGEELGQVAFWRYNVYLPQGQMLDFWLEYSKDPSVSVSLEITQFVEGSLAEIAEHWKFDETESAQVIQVESKQGGQAFVSICARGSGTLRIIALHKRNSRGSHGYFLPGGERYVTSDREELFCYFDPRDMKPPLNVFFSGWEIPARFQGYNLNRKLGCPFLLLKEHRLRGGSFYVGSKEYEAMVLSVIRNYMRELGFSSNQVILSGLSMGAYASMYYGCDIRPHALVLMKPLAGIGNVAANEKYSRPGGYPTSLDVLKFLGGDTDLEAIKKVNEKFWKKFDSADWGESKFIISYMIEDDFESGVYEEMLSHLRSGGVQVYGRGLHGRHGDAQAATANWFSSQFIKMLSEDFPERYRE